VPHGVVVDIATCKPKRIAETPGPSVDFRISAPEGISVFLAGHFWFAECREVAVINPDRCLLMMLSMNIFLNVKIPCKSILATLRHG